MNIFGKMFCNFGKNMKRKRKKKLPTKIILERIYLGGQSLEDAFRKINENTVKETIEEMMIKSV